ncbi:mucin-16, partial [Sigmodon hispidus]
GDWLVPFTLNFTITNLEYKEDMLYHGSRNFRTLERVLQYLLKPLFKTSSLGSLYSGCTLVSLRSKKNGTATRVDAICTYNPDPKGHQLDREQLYWELNRLTHGVTRLDPYNLDRDSLYVNGFTHQSSALLTSTSGTTTNHSQADRVDETESVTISIIKVSPLVPFTINFTITNLKYEDSMHHPGSWKFNTTERILQRLLWSVFNKTSISLLYSGCRLILLRPEKDRAATGVDAICNHHPDSSGSVLENEQVYWELMKLTNNITQLGPYSLDQDSLYINGYTQHILSSTSMTPMRNKQEHAYASMSRSSSPFDAPSSTAGLVLAHFTINFTIFNLAFEEDMSRPGSQKFNITERTLQSLLRPLFQKSSVGPLYSGCLLTSLRSENGGAGTGVDAVCTHHPDPTGLGMDRKMVYWELSRMTYGVSRLGPYTLDQNSLYVDGYTHHILANTTKIAGPVPVPFTINFTVINLEYVKDMGDLGSRKFNATERILQKLLRALFSKISVGPLYSGCRLTLLRPENNGSATGVNAICSYHANTSNQGLDREHVYWELKRLSNGTMKLGPYTLDQDSLYVNGPVMMLFSINFTIINLEYEEDMAHPGSRKFIITERTLQSLLNPLFNKTSVGPLYSGCRLTLLRAEKNGTATVVDATCTYHLDPAGLRLENEQIYGELSSLTQSVTQLGPYILDKNSLYVNGYTHQNPLMNGIHPEVDCLYREASEAVFKISELSLACYTQQIAATSTTKSLLVLFTFNFTITNLFYEEEMELPGSKKFNTTDKILQRLLGSLFRNTSIGDLYTGCRLTLLSSRKDGEATGVDTVCTYHPDHIGHGLAREQLYLELSKLTYHVTQLGPYTLDQDSLYVNGYTHPVSAGNGYHFGVAAQTTTTTEEVSEEMFTVNFTINNLRYSADMGQMGSPKFNITDTLMQHLLSPLFQRSSLGPLYTGCRVATLRSVKNGAQTQVDVLCKYRQVPKNLGLPAKSIFNDLSWQTHGITRLGPYSLDKDSLYINGYNEPGPDVPPTKRRHASEQTSLPREAKS